MTSIASKALRTILILSLCSSVLKSIMLLRWPGTISIRLHFQAKKSTVFCQIQPKMVSWAQYLELTNHSLSSHTIIQETTWMLYFLMAIHLTTKHSYSHNLIWMVYATTFRHHYSCRIRITNAYRFLMCRMLARICWIQFYIPLTCWYMEVKQHSQIRYQLQWTQFTH